MSRTALSVLFAVLALACAAASAQPLETSAAAVPSQVDRSPGPLSGRLPPTATAGARYPGVQVSATVEQPSALWHPPGELPTPGERIRRGEAIAIPGMTLEQITQIALADSPIIREARNQLIAAQGKAMQAGLYPNPTLGHASPQAAGDETQYNGYVKQDIVTKGKIRLDATAAWRAARAAEMALVRARFDLLTMIRKRFYTALAMQRRVEVLEQMVDIARRSRDIGERLLAAGVGPRSDVLLLEIELSKAEAELKNAHTLAETSRRELAAGTGLVDLAIERVEGDLTQRLPDYHLVATQDGVLSRNALVSRAQFEIARSRVLLRRAEVEPFPNINLMGGYQNQLTGIDIPTNQGIYEVQLVIPLWNRNQGNIRAAQATVGASVAAYNRVRTELANETALALGRYITARQLADRYQNEILPAAFEVQRITAQLYNQGQVEFLRYLASQRALLDASLANIDAQEQRWNAAADVAGLLQSEEFP